MGNCKQLTIPEAAALVKEWDRVLILSHQKPDGDTLGSGLALLRELRKLGKTVRLECSDGFPQRFSFLYEGLDLESQPMFEPEHVIAVDIADPQLLGEATQKWEGQVELCIDHHPSNTCYARNLVLNSQAAGTVELIYVLLLEMGLEVEGKTAQALYTGLTTDTGCFRYSNVTARTHFIAGKLIEAGVDHFPIDKLMFETKTPARMELERITLETLEYAFEGRLAFLVVSRQAVESTGVPDAETDGLAAIPRQIAGVEVGATLKEREPGVYRVSMRTNQYINASQVCAQLGGGGHPRAAGCTLHGSLAEVKARLIQVLAPEMKRCQEQGLHA